MTAATIAAPPYQSEAWQEWRLHGLGASELPTVAGVNPYQTEYQLAAMKRGQVAAFEGNEKTRWGTRMEALGIEVYRETTGRDVVTGETFADPRWPHLWATLDARDGRVGVEVKYSARWDTLPQRVEVQGLGQIGLAGLDAVDVVKLGPYGEPTITRIKRVEREDEIRDLLDLGEAWYVRYVLGDEMPPLDGSPEARRHLDGLVGDAEMKADAAQAQMVRELRYVRESLGTLTERKEALERDIKQSMAGTGVLLGAGFRATWAPVKGRSAIEWKSVATGLSRFVTPDEYDVLVSLATTTGEAGTRFAVKYEEETE